MTPTYCSACDNVVEDTRKRLPTQWLCRMHPRIEGQGFVDPKLWVEKEPFLRCKDTNGGACPVFVPMRTPTSKPTMKDKANAPEPICE